VQGEQASRRHAEIVREGAVFMIRDLDSRNGLHVNGVRVPQAPLRPGTLLRVGEWVGLVIMLEAEADLPDSFFCELLPGYWAGPVLAPCLAPLQRAAAADLPVIVQGETGTGKEGVAQAAHLWSGRRGPLLALNCAALPEQLAEGELFGYRKGAFTGADRANPGHLRSADGGTLFLDEVAELPLGLQAKLLRALEQHEVIPLGESSPVKIDVHLVAATQAPLSEAVAAGRFRADLYARLDGLTIELPAAAPAHRGIALSCSCVFCRVRPRASRCPWWMRPWSSPCAFTTGRSTCASWIAWPASFGRCTVTSPPCWPRTCRRALSGRNQPRPHRRSLAPILLTPTWQNARGPARSPRQRKKRGAVPGHQPPAPVPHVGRSPGNRFDDIAPRWRAPFPIDCYGPKGEAMKTMRVATWICLACALAACSSSHQKLDLGGTCSLNSDCNEPLLCKFGYCHKACVRSVDCDNGGRCTSVEFHCHRTRCCDHVRGTIRSAMQYPHPSPEGEGGLPEIVRRNSAA
jgi:hypothetical protein